MLFVLIMQGSLRVSKCNGKVILWTDMGFSKGGVEVCQCNVCSLEDGKRQIYTIYSEKNCYSFWFVLCNCLL